MAGHQHHLHGGGQVGLAAGGPSAQRSGRPSEEPVEPPGGHAPTPQEGEVRGREVDRPVPPHDEELITDGVDVHGPAEGSIARFVEPLARLKDQGLLRHIGVSNVTRKQVDEARSITHIACVQNAYNLANRADDDLIDYLAGEGIAYVPFFPLGGFNPLQSDTLNRVAASLDASPMQTALAWLLQRSPNILLIPGTSSVAHLRENVAAADLELPPEALAELETIGR